jgi:superfamily I DNA/RNA helicase
MPNAPQTVDLFAKPAPFAPTPQQAAIVAATLDCKSIKVVAAAGAGKTRTLQLIADAHRDRRGLYLCFNQGIAEEASRRFPRSVTCRTAHSLAFRALNMGRYQAKLARKLFPEDVIRFLGLDLRDRSTELVVGQSLLGMIKRFCHSAAVRMSDEHLPPDEGVPPASAARLIEEAQRLWEAMADLDRVDMPMTHDCYLKLWHLRGGALAEFDYILFDEAQDANGVMIAIARQCEKQVIFVGDPYQQIYSWRGAVNALDDLDLPEFPLTQSFRFGPDVAAVANWTLSHKRIKPRYPVEGCAPWESWVLSVNHRPDGNMGCTGPAASVYRTNAQMFLRAAFAPEKNIFVLGGIAETIDLVEAGYAMCNGRRPRKKNDKIARFNNWHELRRTADVTEDRDLRLLVKLFSDYGRDIPDMIARLEASICTNEADAELLLSTAHAFKGREADEVTIAGDFDTPAQLVAQCVRARRAGKSDDVARVEEEFNLLYVAQTRAKRLLRLPDAMKGAFDRSRPGSDRWGSVGGDPA